MTQLFPNVDWDAMLLASQETLFMTVIAALATFIFGLIIGLFLFLTSKDQLLENKFFNTILAAFVNIFRSIPFIILIILLIPFTIFILGSMLGAKAALPALIIGAAPFYARMVEIGLREIDKGVIEAARAMGASTFTIILKVLIPEALPAIISGLTVTTIAIVGYTAMAGVVGGGGLGNLAFMEGYQRSNNQVTLVATVIILLIVFILQFIGDLVTTKIDKRA
ncbi:MULTISPECIES: methionine ABC transporter permease [unclassified Bacillus (in: firmicutes)]|jgi:D-methionine transport system permease protein|uniref:methionine ABC transporter permease n=1 Tax=unclassified Bacillus (in: firmicutes) TaxID=185979 RepID=UPI0008E5DC2E|nr:MULTISPECIES: methionine ABC transporter permease [unclassified Bacillus (in: firmicutes)]PGZ93248.1 ABC transporter permease [Bacillus sp. AFS029533]SFD23097.1 D-methionine transport system permease protein [Bacillus sp. UNCCL81]